MNCGNCGKGNEYGAKICVHCGSTLALTEYFRRKGFVEKKDTPKKPKEEPWDQEILTTGYQSKRRQHIQEEQVAPIETQRRPASGDRRSTGRNSGASRRAENGSRPGEEGTRQNRSSSRQRGDGEQRTSQERTGSGKRSDTPSGKGGKSTSARERKNNSEPNRSSKKGQAGAGSASPKEKGKEKPKKIPKSKAYNHTTKSLSLAEKMVKKKTENNRGNNRRKWILSVAVILVILIVAAGIFIGTMHFSADEDIYLRTAENFVQAMVMEDEAALADCVHPKMHGILRTMGYENVERCDTKIVEYQKIEASEIPEELKNRYGISDSVGSLYRVHVGCTIHGAATYACAMDVIVAEIGDSIYAVKTENISNSPGVP